MSKCTEAFCLSMLDVFVPVVVGFVVGTPVFDFRLQQSKDLIKTFIWYQCLLLVLDVEHTFSILGSTSMCTVAHIDNKFSFDLVLL